MHVSAIEKRFEIMRKFFDWALLLKKKYYNSLFLENKLSNSN